MEFYVIQICEISIFFKVPIPICALLSFSLAESGDIPMSLNTNYIVIILLTTIWNFTLYRLSEVSVYYKVPIVCPYAHSIVSVK